MTNSKFKFALIALFAISLSFTSCGDNAKNADSTDKIENQGKEYTSAYVCPMHCEGSGSENEGLCPVCGMDYVKNNKQSK